MPHARSTSRRSSLGVSIDSRKQARFSIKRSRPDIHEHEIDIERAALLQATGRYEDALVLREKLANGRSGDSHAWRARVAAS